MPGMTEAERAAIRRERLTMSMVEIARKHTITRQRVHQILNEQPNEQQRLIEAALGIDVYEEPPVVVEDLSADAVGTNVVRFRSKRLKHLENIEVPLCGSSAILLVAVPLAHSQ